MKVGNSIHKFAPGVIAELGTYVYALRDPRDKKVFYVGKGNGNRVFDHFGEAKNEKLSTSKLDFAHF